MYTISQVAEMFNLPISTLRYYDKQGLFPELKRVSGIRKFDEKEIETLRIIECLKKSGLEIKDIKQFIDWCMQGESTFLQRSKMLNRQKETVENEIKHLNKVLDMLKYKCWYYEQAIADGTDKKVKSLIPDKLPADIKLAYDNAHK